MPCSAFDLLQGDPAYSGHPLQPSQPPHSQICFPPLTNSRHHERMSEGPAPPHPCSLGTFPLFPTTDSPLLICPSVSSCLPRLHQGLGLGDHKLPQCACIPPSALWHMQGAEGRLLWPPHVYAVCRLLACNLSILSPACHPTCIQSSPVWTKCCWLAVPFETEMSRSGSVWF